METGARRQCRCWCCELAAPGDGDMLALLPGGGGGDGAASWLCACWRQVACVGCRAAAGAVSWLRTWWRQVAGCGAGAGWVPLLVLVLGAGCARGGDRVPGAGCHRPTAASDSEVPAVMAA